MEKPTSLIPRFSFRLFSLLAFTAASLLFAASAPDAATYGWLFLYSDAGHTDCTLVDNTPRFVDVYVVHKIDNIGDVGGDAYLLAFRLSASVGFTGTWIQEVVPAGITKVGTSPAGIAMGYNACRTGDVEVLRVTYQLFGTSSPCSSLQATAYPGYDFIYTQDCSFTDRAVAGRALVVNQDASCPCQIPVAAEPTTWGHVKALYR